jgi:competence protein ComEC
MACVPLLLVALLALRHRLLRPLLWFVAAAVWTVWSAQARLDERLPAAALGRDVEIAGWVDGFPSPAPGQTTFSFRVAPRASGVPPRVRLTWYDPPAELVAGAAFTLTARLRPPHGTRNPGGFDYEQWLLVNALGATGYVRAGAVAPPARDWRAQWLRFRATLAQRLAAAAPDDDAAALLTALAIGERFRFSERHWSDFRRTGTSHLVAVSGMHVALLGLVVFAALRWLWLRLPAPLHSFDLEAAATASVLATAYYAALTGFALPAQRSLVMIAVALAVLASRHSVGATQALAATLLVVLVWDPFAPLSASFWLSFVAVAVLLALAAARPVSVARPGIVVRAVSAGRVFVALQWSIGIALLPITAWYFGEVSVVGPVVNWVAIPLFNLALVPLTVLATIALSFDGLVAPAAALVQATGHLASATVAALHAVAEAPFAALAVPAAPWPTRLLAALGVAVALLAPPLPGRRLAWLALLPMFVPHVSLPRDGEVRAVVLDVGHGLAVLVETRRHRLLFDAGPAFRSGFDSGEELVLPALAATGRRGLDLLLVSHADNDHSGGAAAVAAAFPRAAVLKGPDVATLPGRDCAQGQEWEWDGVRFSVVHPGSGFAARGNESSCVLKITAASGALLLTGDIERRGEAAIAALPIAADVVVVPHHGSATSSSAGLVAAVGAEHAVVSAGFANRWGFPKPEVRARWEESGAEVVVTGESGAVSIVLGREGITVRAERDGRHRYWQAVAAADS